MTAFLPSNLLALFAARPPIPYLPPLDKLGHQKKPWPYSGIASIVADFEDPEDTPAPTRAETRVEKIERKKCERIEKNKADLERAAEEWDPHTDPNAVTDAFKTLFVGRLNYDTSENKLRREMEVYGPVKSIQMVTNSTTGKPRGYCFVEFEHERDMHTAYKHADGKKIDGRRIVVDVERGRTVKNWKPRRLGGGLGGTRNGAPEANIKHSGRVENFDRDRDRDERDRGGEYRDRSRRDRERDRGRDRDRDRHDRRRERDREVRDRDGRDREFRDREGRDREGRDREGRDREGRDREGRDREGRDRDRDRDRERRRNRDDEKSRDGEMRERVDSGRERGEERSREEERGWERDGYREDGGIDDRDEDYSRERDRRYKRERNEDVERNGENREDEVKKIKTEDGRYDGYDLNVVRKIKEEPRDDYY